MFQKLFTKLSLTIPLGWLLSHFFMWSNNAHTFTNKALLISSGFIVVVAIILGLLSELWIKLCNKLFAQRAQLATIINTVFISAVFSIIVSVFLLEPSLTSTPILLSMLICFACTCVALYYAKHILNTLLAVMLIFSVGEFSYNIIDLNIEAMAEKSKTSEDIGLVDFKETPNIYLFWLESYHDFATQRDVYGIDTKPMQNFLSQNKFITHDHIYTDSWYTIRSFTELYGMGHFDSKIVGTADAKTITRDLIGGNENNLLLKNLKHNGYHTTHIFASKNPEYYITNYNPATSYLDQTDHSAFVSSPLMNLLPCYYFANSISTRIKDFIASYNTIFTGNRANRVNTAMQNGLKSGKPFYISFKGGANHTPYAKGYTFLNEQEWIDSKKYNKLMQNGNKEIKVIVQNIVEHDPNSIIILITDHGPFRFRDVNKGVKSVKELIDKLQRNNIVYEEFVDDIFGGILAMRFPNGEQVDISNGYYMSQRNLFLHIFAYLSDDLSLLEKRKVSESKEYRFILTRDGKILYE